jgi:hypothetical protein
MEQQQAFSLQARSADITFLLYSMHIADSKT